jgi:hypothetical protein
LMYMHGYHESTHKMTNIFEQVELDFLLAAQPASSKVLPLRSSSL